MTRRLPVAAAAFAAALGSTAMLRAQGAPAGSTPSSRTGTTPAAEAAPAPPAPDTQPQGYTYNPHGRRDPFVSLLRGGTDAQGQSLASRPSGLAGLSSAEVALKGTVQSRSGYVALVQGADQKTYIVRPGDKLLDGTIRAITATSMVILQQVNDPLSLQKVREIRKVLRQADEVK